MIFQNLIEKCKKVQYCLNFDVMNVMDELKRIVNTEAESCNEIVFLNIN
jgi:hypothetical protein